MSGQSIEHMTKEIKRMKESQKIPHTLWEEVNEAITTMKTVDEKDREKTNL